MLCHVQYTGDFDVTGDGEHRNWERASWLALTRVGSGKSQYATRCKVLWSNAGVYLLFDCEDTRLSCTQTDDFGKIYEEDVVEVFLWTNEAQTVYFEYELSPLNVELPLLVPNDKGDFLGWLPWQYTGERRVRHAVTVYGGEARSGAVVCGWTAEMFIPFGLLRALGNVPPVPGTRWRGNFYRIDYDQQPPSHWAWCAETGNHFHDFYRFGTLIFER